MQLFPWNHLIMSTRFFHSPAIFELDEALTYDPNRSPRQIGEPQEARPRKSLHER